MKKSTNVDQPLRGPHALGEEVAGPQRLGVPLDELAPSALSSLRARVEAVLLQDRFTVERAKIVHRGSGAFSSQGAAQLHPETGGASQR